jgi:hypothetical protein
MSGNTVSYNGSFYSTLANVAVNSSSKLCQSNAIAMPAGWTLAPDNSDTRYVISYYRWSTDAVVLASGVGIRTANLASAGSPYGDSRSKIAVDSSGAYYTPWCSYEILIAYVGCAAGQHLDSVSSRCVPCAPGSFSNRGGADVCMPCSAGRYNTGYGNTGCIDCAAGKVMCILYLFR